MPYCEKHNRFYVGACPECLREEKGEFKISSKQAITEKIEVNVKIQKLAESKAGKEKQQDVKIKELLLLLSSMIELAEAGETKLMKYINTLKVIKDTDIKLYNMIYKTLNVLIMRDPNVNKSLDQLMDLPDYDIKISRDTLEGIKRCLIDFIKHIG